MYEYHCEQQGHSLTQFGTITVIDPSGVQSYAAPENIILFPIPADDVLMVALYGCTGVVRGEVIDLSGHVVKSQHLVDARTNSFDLSGVAPGQYFLLVYGSTGKPLMRKFVKGS
ncbi:MAG: T9SS type A sorting domain-containing protein [Flavobacteriales bacterium]|nr:T9SS type A sorting domain-containing protein [Flavobacteriales bacterium]